MRVYVEGARTQFEPGYIRVRVMVEPHQDNRGLTVAAISEGFSRSSYEQLEGVRSPRTRWIDWPNVPSGEYDIIARVTRATGRTVQDRAHVSVLVRGG